MVEMLGQMLDGLLSVFQLKTLIPIFLGVPIGLVFGILPGISGTTTMAILIPFIFSMGLGPVPSLAFLLAAHAVVYTGGSISAVLLNIPGAGPNTATLIDGYPMTQKGLAGRALGNCLVASGLGGIFGGFALILLIFIIKPIVLAFGLPEYFFLVVLGLSFIAVIGSESPIKGLISGIMGVFISFFGIHVVTGEPRFTFGSLQLLEGFELITVGLGLFAAPSVVSMLTRKETSIAKVDKAEVRPGLVWEGTKDIFRNFRLFVQSSIIGTFIGVVPGVGGDVAPFVAYGIAKQTSKNPEAFGKGSVEGVIAPEASNNAKEGGSLLPTLAFGIPGSAGMALMLGALLIAGIQPGPLFLEEHTDIAFSLAVTVIFANVIGAVIMLLVSKYISAIAFVRGGVIGPVVLCFIAVGGYCARGNLWDDVFVAMFGILGVAMGKFGYNKPAAFLGVVLGSMFERYFRLALIAHGLSFLKRPLSLLLILMIISVLFFDKIRSLFDRFARRENEE